MSNPAINAGDSLDWQAIDNACQRIAPSWPLDQAIAVNPWWQMRQTSIQEVAAKLNVLGQLNCLMPKDYYLGLWQRQIHPQHLEAAKGELGILASQEELLGYLREENRDTGHWLHFSELLDRQPGQHKKIPWHDEIIQQISQFCGLYFQYPERFQTKSGEQNLYRTWLEVSRQDKGIEVLMGEKGLHQRLLNLPADHRQLLSQFFDQLNINEHIQEYAYSLLLDIHGWASWMAYHAWQADFDNRPCNLLEQLLAIRAAWEWILWHQWQSQHPNAFAFLSERFKNQSRQYPDLEYYHLKQQEMLWVWQRALELSYQQALQQKLLNSEPTNSQSPSLQAVFCIDVRSEPMRRALESQDDGIETLGFAGFFGLPLEYAPSDGHYRRPQLPGLLAPTIRAELCDINSAKSQPATHNHALHQKQASFDTAPASFGLVEMLGLGKATKLLQQSWFPSSPGHPINRLPSEGSWVLSRDGQVLEVQDKAELAQGILTAMGISSFAPIVLLLGHGSCTTNNPQAAGLDCGACGGQTGEVNVKVLAQLLNDNEVRQTLAGKGIRIPDSTLFVPGLHNTTTDEIRLFEPQEVKGHATTLAACKDWLCAATEAAQRARANAVGIDAEGSRQHLRAGYQKKASDWAEVRPEWGLANNASFIVAPREVTKSVNLEGRSFLHDYHWQNDKDFATLELIMTAPMIVTNWINLQYFASVTDNDKYGSGNKLLHNVVGGNIGVFEGNAGDLRIGLAKQSVHNGQEWQHQPLRLSVYIDAPCDALQRIIDKHEPVANLLNNGWLYLFQWNTQNRTFMQYHQRGWRMVPRRG